MRVYWALLNIVLGMLVMLPGALAVVERYDIGWQFLVYVFVVSYLITMATTGVIKE